VKKAHGASAVMPATSPFAAEAKLLQKSKASKRWLADLVGSVLLFCPHRRLPYGHMVLVSDAEQMECTAVAHAESLLKCSQSWFHRC
jgi:hypothetical protein